MTNCQLYVCNNFYGGVVLKNVKLYKNMVTPLEYSAKKK